MLGHSIDIDSCVALGTKMMVVGQCGEEKLALGKRDDDGSVIVVNGSESFDVRFSKELQIRK